MIGVVRVGGVCGQQGALDTATFNKGGRSADSLAAPFAIPSGQDPDEECPTGAATCGGFCDGAGERLETSAGKQCAAASCSGSDVLLQAASCPAEGNQCPARVQVSCGAGSCRNAACTSRCASDTDCADGAECNGGQRRVPSPDAGCGCRSGSKAPPGAWLLIGLLAALVRRRSRTA